MNFLNQKYTLNDLLNGAIVRSPQELKNYFENKIFLSNLYKNGGKITEDELKEKLENEHKLEAKKENAEFMNYGWATDNNGIASKTSKGILESKINPKTEVVTHGWFVYGFDILSDNKGISKSEDGSAWIKDDDEFKLIEIPIDKVKVNKRFTYDWYVKKGLDEDVSISSKTIVQ